MIERIFRSILTASIAVMLSVLIIITSILYSYFGEVQHQNLKTELKLASTAVEQKGIEYLSALNINDYRLTWIAKDGTVLFDTSVDARTMENHSDREEIREAFTSTTGESERNSATLLEKTIYYAELLQDGTVLRVSSSYASVLSLVLGMLQPIIVVFVILIIISVILAKRMAKHIVKPLNELDLENPLDNKAYEELSPLLRRINALQSKVRNQLVQLKSKNEEFEQIISNMNEGLVLLDKQGIIISINNAAMHLFSTNIECVGKDFLTIDRSIETQNAINKALIDGHSEMWTERSGNAYQFEISRIEFDKNTIGAVLLTFNVTEKTYAERNRREFTANVSHELKTPLQSIMGSAELMENGLVKAADIPRFVSRIRQEAARLVTLINDIIQLSQLDEDSEMLHEEVDIHAVASEVLNELQYAADAKYISFTLSGDSLIINGVKKLFGEIIYNLCDNAIKYTDINGHVDVDIKSNGINAILTVTDNGIGIPAEHQSRIFERFYRVDKSHSKASGGTGLGLSIVKHAVQYHHGMIEVQSDVGHGSVFTVTLPL